MQVDIQRANDRFRRIFRALNLMWVIISVIGISASAYSLFSKRPDYLYDWHGVAIIVLALSVLVIYSVGLFGGYVLKEQDEWPPALHRALTYWLSIYIGILLLSEIDANFSWNLFIVMGASFALF